MQHRIFHHDAWLKMLCRIATHPTARVVAALALVALAAWIVVETQFDLRHDRAPIPLLFGQK